LIWSRSDSSIGLKAPHPCGQLEHTDEIHCQ
jgi:hypothetical protein